MHSPGGRPRLAQHYYSVLPTLLIMQDSTEHKFNGSTMTTITKTRNSTAHAKPSKPSDQGHLPSTGRRPRAYSYTTRRLLFSRLDSWLSGMLPPPSRAVLLTVPSLPTLTFLYCLLSVTIFSGCVVSSLLKRSLEHAVTHSQGHLSLFRGTRTHY